MKTTRRQNLIAAALVCMLALSNVYAQTPSSITTQDSIETRLGLHLFFLEWKQALAGSQLQRVSQIR